MSRTKRNGRIAPQLEETIMQRVMSFDKVENNIYHRIEIGNEVLIRKVNLDSLNDGWISFHAPGRQAIMQAAKDLNVTYLIYLY